MSGRVGDEPFLGHFLGTVGRQDGHVNAGSVEDCAACSKGLPLPAGSYRIRQLAQRSCSSLFGRCEDTRMHA